MKTLNLGIIAHVDAGKTSLTERLLFNAGIISKMGSVDGGNTQTDSLELERERGITIQAGVVSFSLEDLIIYLIDTPGHSDFIAEVERSLKVLDGVILVISAVEGVQTQTRVLMRTLKKLKIPTILFVNKIDRRGANDEKLVEVITQKLTDNCVVMNAVSALGTCDAKVSMLPREWNLIAEETAKGTCHPLFFGSAITGAGILELQAGIQHLLPSNNSCMEGPLKGMIFKIERGSHNEKIAYLRLYSGHVRVRQTLTFCRREGASGVYTYQDKVTAIHIIQKDKNKSIPTLSAGHIAKIIGIQNARVGDRLQGEESEVEEALFSPPTLEVVIVVQSKSQEPSLYAALQVIAEQDPWINVRVEPSSKEITVSLYGEVQKEVLKARLEREFSLRVHFKDPKTIYKERVLGVGEMLQDIHRRRHNEFYARIGLRIEPGEPGCGIIYRLGVEKGCIPKSYHTAIEEGVRETLMRGLFGWEVTDCMVTLTKAGICPLSSVSEFRKSTPLVIMEALQRAKTYVCEPYSSFELETPLFSMNSVIAKLIEESALIEETKMNETEATLLGTIPTARLHELEKHLPGLTQGSAVLFSRFGGYESVKGKAPTRVVFDGGLVDRRMRNALTID